MLQTSDLERIRSLYELDCRGALGDYVTEVMGELREQGLGRWRDPRELPFLQSALRAYIQLYQPPSLPQPAEVIHALFPGLRIEIADRVLQRKIRELKTSAERRQAK
jgi:hypothetical protein